MDRGGTRVTSPINVGQVSVDLVAEARGLAASIRKEVEAAFQGLDINAMLRESVGNTRIKIPVEADLNVDGIGEKVRSTRVPKVPVELDPVLAAFQAEVRAQADALAKTVNAKIPVGADGSRLRAELGAEIAAVQAQLKIEVPTEPGAKAEYEAKLKALVETASARVKAHIKVEAETKDLSFLSGAVGNFLPDFGGISAAVGGIGSAIQGLADGVGKFALNAAEGGSQLAGSIAAAAGPIGSIIALLVTAGVALAGLGAGASLVVPAMTAVAGAAAAIPAALVGAGAIFGTLSLGFKGISEAFKPKPAGGGAGSGQQATQQAQQIAAGGRSVEAAKRGIAAANRGLDASERSLAAAQRGTVQAQQKLVDAEHQVTTAQKTALLAQQAVSKARVEAAHDIDAMNRSLKGARLSEESAALGVTDALRALNSARLTGNIPDIQRADLAYRQSLQTLDDAKASTTDLEKSTASANAKGVEGSDKVQSALRSQASAVEGVHKAQEGVLSAQNGILDSLSSLKSAQDGVLSAQDGIKSAADSLKSAQDSLAQAQTKQATAGAAAAASVIKLAPAAQKFVDALKALKPAFENLRLDVQQRLFEGLDQTVTHVGEAWIPALRITLGSYADTFNGFFKNLGSAITTPKFIGDIQAGAEGARQGLSHIFDAITTSLVPAFGALSRAAGPFLDHLGKSLGSVVTKFSDWVLAGEKSGKLQSFFDRASVALDQIGTTGKIALQIVGDIFTIIAGPSKKTGQTGIETFNNGLQKLDTYLKDPKHQQQIRDFVDSVTNAFTEFGHAATKVDEFLQKLDGKKGQGHSVGYDIGAAVIAGLIAGFEGAFVALYNSWIGPFIPGGALIQGILNALGIHSPSTVFADVGKNCVEGLIQGFESLLGSVTTAVGDIGNTVINAASTAGTWLFTHGQNVVIGLANGIGQGLQGLSTFAQNMRTTVQNALNTAGTWLYTHGRNVVIGLVNGIGSLFNNLGTFAGNARVYVQNALSNAGSWLFTHGRNAIIGLENGIGSLFSNLGAFAGNARIYVQNALYDAGSWLYNHGVNVVIGLYNGIASFGGWLYNKVADFIKNNIKDAAKSILDIRSPSRVMAEIGKFIPQGLAAGINAEGDKVKAAADRMAALAVPDINGNTFDLSAQTNAAITSSLQASTQQQVMIGFKPNVRGDKLLEALRDAIDIGYQGNIERALTRTR